MALCTLLKGDLLPRSSELLADNKILLDIWMWYLCNKLIVLSNEVTDLLTDIRIILKLIDPTDLFLPRRVAFLIIVLINLMPMLTRWRNYRMIYNGDLDILQK